jgi:tetratricopeptide (TPR) repeat protein
LILLPALAPAAHPLQEEQRLKEAERAFQEGRVEGALALYEAAIQEEPSNLEALQMAGYIRYSAMDYGEAERHFSTALAQAAPSRTAYPLLMLGNIAFQRFRFVDALEYYRAASRLNPEDRTLRENIRLSEERLERAGRVARLYGRGSWVFWAGTALGAAALLIIAALEVLPSFREAKKKPASRG